LVLDHPRYRVRHLRSADADLEPAMSNREELVLLLREIMRWEKTATSDKMVHLNDWPPFKEDASGDAYLNGEITVTGKPRDDAKDAWDDLHDILNRAHVAISTDTRKRVRQRPQKAVL